MDSENISNAVPFGTMGSNCLWSPTKIYLIDLDIAASESGMDS